MANNIRKQTSQVQTTSVNHLEEVQPTSNNTKIIPDQKEVTVKLNNNKTLRIVHVDAQTVVINGKPFKRELVKSYLSNVHNKKKQQINGRPKKHVIIRRLVKQEPKATASSTTPISLVNGNKSVNSETQSKSSMLRTRLLTSTTPNNKTKDKDSLFNENHSNSEGIKFLQDQFQSSPALKSILAEIATLQKEYDDLEENLLDKEVETMRARHSLPSMMHLNRLFKKRPLVRAETVVRPPKVAKPIPAPEPVPVPEICSNETSDSMDNETDSSSNLVIDESEIDEIELTKPRATKNQNCACPTCLLKKNFVLERQLESCNNVSKIGNVFALELLPQSELKIGQVFSNGKKIVSCDKCSFDGTEEEVTKHSYSHFKKVKGSHVIVANQVEYDVEFLGSSVKIKTETDDCILIEDSD